MLPQHPLKYLYLLGCSLVSVFSWGQKSTPRTYTALRTDAEISIDGKADEVDWQKAAWSADFIDIEGEKKPTYRTHFKMLWDDTYMYYYVEIEEPHIWANLRQRDTVIFYNNDFEIFWDPDGDTHNYYEFEVNALNTIWDLFLTKPYREANATMDSWDISEAKSAIIVNGTLNTPTDTDKGWQLELAIPWAAFRTSFGQDNVPRNQFWRMNFSRVNWDFELHDGIYGRKKDAKGNYLPEYNWVWSPQGVINMHEPEKWGYVYFEDKQPSEKRDFQIPQEEQIRWYLYKMYREMKQKQYCQNLSQLPNSSLDYAGKTLKPVLERHLFGWNIFIKTPQKTYLIREDGKYSIIQN